MFFRQGIGLYVDWLWFQEVGYAQLFATMLFYKFILAVLPAGFSRCCIYVNLKIASSSPAGFRFSRADNIIELPPPDLIDPLFQRLLLPGALFVGPDGRAPGRSQLGTAVAVFQCGIVQSARSSVWPRHWVLCVSSTDVFGMFTTGRFSPSALTAVATAAVYFLYRGIEYTPHGPFFRRTRENSSVDPVRSLCSCQSRRLLIGRF